MDHHPARLKGIAFGRVVPALILYLVSGTLLHAQAKRVEIELFGLKPFSLKPLPVLKNSFNAYGDSWQSFQEISFDGDPSPLGPGAGMTLWIRDRLGLRIQGRMWSRRGMSAKSTVRIDYTFTPWYPSPAPDPVTVSYEVSAVAQPALSFRVGALSLAAVARFNLGRLDLDLSAGPSLFQIGGELRDLYYKRVEHVSHGTFLSEEASYTSRFDFMSLGGCFGADLSIPIGGSIRGVLGLQVMLGGARRPDMFVASMEEGRNFVIPGPDAVQARTRFGDLKINPSTLIVNFGLRYASGPAENAAPWLLRLDAGVSGMNRDLSFRRGIITAENRSRLLEQDIRIFSRKWHGSFGGALGFRFQPSWALELGYLRQEKDLDVTAGLNTQIVDEQWSGIIKGQRPGAGIVRDEFRLSLVRFIQVSGAEILVSAGADLARLGLRTSDEYLLYWHEPWTPNFVSYSGLFATAGSGWTTGGHLEFGLRFPVLGPLFGRITAAYSIYPESEIRMSVESIELDADTYGAAATVPLAPEDLQSRISPGTLSFNPSHFRILWSLGLGIR